MQIWNFELQQLGFAQRSETYWQCTKGYGLESGEHVSLFLRPSKPRTKQLLQFELYEFHVTIKCSIHNLHFYYHEVDENRWERAGHTSSFEIQSLGNCPSELKRIAEAIAQNLVAAIGGSLEV